MKGLPKAYWFNTMHPGKLGQQGGTHGLIILVSFKLRHTADDVSDTSELGHDNTLFYLIHQHPPITQIDTSQISTTSQCNHPYTNLQPDRDNCYTDTHHLRGVGHHPNTSGYSNISDTMAYRCDLLHDTSKHLAWHSLTLRPLLY